MEFAAGVYKAKSCCIAAGFSHSSVLAIRLNNNSVRVPCRGVSFAKCGSDGMIPD